MTQLTNNRYDIEYNRKEIERRIDRLCSVARGTDMSILHLVNDADGKFSDKKAMSFINALIRTSGTKGKTARFYKAFLYCTLRCHANESICTYYGMYERFRPCSTFQDILDRARLADKDCKAVGLKDMDDIMFHEYIGFEDYNYENRGKDSFFTAMDVFYEWLTGNDYTSVDPEGFERFFAENSRYREYSARRNTWYAPDPDGLDSCYEELAKEGGYDSYGQLLADWYEEEEAWAEAAKSDPDYVSEDDYANEKDKEFWREVDAVNKRNEPAWNRFRDEFRNIDRFVSMYMEYRKLFCEVYHYDLYDHIESMVYSYMYDNNLSSFASDPVVVDEMAVLDDITSQLQAALIRSRRRNGL